MGAQRTSGDASADHGMGPDPVVAPAVLYRVVISVADVDRAMGLYRSVLGCALESRSGDLAFLRLGDGTEVVLHERAVERGDAAIALSFGVPDLDVAFRAWVAGGGAIIGSPARQPWGEVQAVVRDLDGHIVCLNEMA